MDEKNRLLEVKDLKVSFFTPAGEVKAVDGISYSLGYNEVMGIVGESGSGKSVEAYSIIGLLQNPGKVIGGSITFEGEDLLAFTPEQMRQFRGNKVSMIFQNPMTCLNPVYTIGNQLMEALTCHDKGYTKEQARARAIEMLELVGINNAEKRIDQYPHEFSGGMRQRAMIAMALICEPKLLIADEPTTALDVTIQAQILELMKELQKKENTSIIFITHNLGVVAEICDRVSVMYAGPHRGAGAGQRHLLQPAAPLYQGAAGLHAPPGRGRPRAADPHRGHAHRPAEPAQGLQLRAAVQGLHEDLPAAEAALADFGDGHTSACWLHFMEDAAGKGGGAQ